MKQESYAIFSDAFPLKSRFPNCKKMTQPKTGETFRMLSSGRTLSMSDCLKRRAGLE